MTAALAPNLDDLRAELSEAQAQLFCDQMIDDWQRCQAESAKTRQRIADLTAQIARIEETL